MVRAQAIWEVAVGEQWVREMLRRLHQCLRTPAQKLQPKWFVSFAFADVIVWHDICSAAEGLGNSGRRLVI